MKYIINTDGDEKTVSKQEITKAMKKRNPYDYVLEKTKDTTTLYLSTAIK